MKSLHGRASSLPLTCLAVLLLGALPWAACDRSSSVGKIGDGEGGGSSGHDAGLLSAGGTTAAATAGTTAGGTTATAQAGSSGGAGQGGATVTGPAGAGAGGKAGALAGGSAVDAGVSVAGGTSGGAGGTHGDAAAVDGHVCPPLTDVYCTNIITDAYGCQVCADSGSGGAAGGAGGKGGSGGTASGAGGKGGSGGTAGVAGGPGGKTSSAGASGSGGSTAKTCQRRASDDSLCRALNYPPLAFFCQASAVPSEACKSYNIIDSGDFLCCPEQYPACPDSPPTQAGACTGSLTCTYGSHPDSTCRTSATCAKNGTWQVRVPPARCSEAQLPAACPASPASGSCSSHGLNCAYADGTYCSCTNCTVEDQLCEPSAPDTWRCWSPPGGECPTYYPNLGSTCSLPASAQCRYTCNAITVCNVEGIWADRGSLCPN